jgi:hypothetical protein
VDVDKATSIDLCAPDVVTYHRGRVEENDAVRGGEKGRLVGAVGDPVEVPLDAADVVALLVAFSFEASST